MANLIDEVRQKLNNYPLLYAIAKFIYHFSLFLPSLWQRYKTEKFQKKCYAEFETKGKILFKSYGKINVCYEAISPKNYWHLAMGSQYEDKFMHTIFEKCIKKGDIVLDIGAHTGMYSIPFGKAVGTAGKVFAFEPESKGYNAIKRNAELNSLTNIVPINIAVSDREGTIDFFVRPDKDTHSIFEKTDVPSPLGIQEKISVKTASVDSLIERGVILSPALVKIDVEGAELVVLDGMVKSAKQIRHILLEIHESALELVGVEDPKSEVEARLKNLGFRKLQYLDRYHLLASKAT